MIQKPKGTYDVYGQEGKDILYIDSLIKIIMNQYNYEYFRTPIFEASELFHRGIGEATDIVSKETYDFLDRGKRKMTLRPEGTASIVRSVIENKLYARPTLPIKAWYTGSMYRYERPQIGRNRELFQWGMEVFGSTNPLLDVEVMSIPIVLFKLLGLNNIVLKINSLGDQATRLNYRDALLDYFKPFYEELSADSKIRYEKNPLRILDSKDKRDRELIKDAPKLYDYLSQTARNDFDKVQSQLTKMGINFEVDPTLVRGFDYYTGIVFEYVAKTDKLGNQNVIGGGGRYDNLVKSLGGPELPAVGLGIGLDRLLLVLNIENIKLNPENELDIYVIPVTKAEENYAVNITNLLRVNGFSSDMDYLNRSLKNNLKQSNRLGAKYIIIIGEEEVSNNILVVKNNETKEEYQIKEEELVDFFDKKLGEQDE